MMNPTANGGPPAAHSSGLPYFKRIVFVAVLLCAAWLIHGGKPAPVNDFAEYWSSAKLLVTGQSPYDVKTVFAFYHLHGIPESIQLIARNPPWMEPLVLPLAIFPYHSAQLLWLALSLLLILWSCHILFRLYSGTDRLPSKAWLAIGLFTPIYIVIAIGQITPFVLLGIAGFLYFQERRYDIGAGICLFLMAIKPHLTFLLWPAGVLWILHTKRWRIAGTFACVMLAASAVPALFSTHVFHDYFSLWQGAVLQWNETPTIGGILCRIFGHSSELIALIPMCIAILWFVFHWVQHSRQWDWIEQAPLLIMISLLTSPYAWFHDQIVLLPALLQVAAKSSYMSTKKTIWLFSLYAFANLAIFALLDLGKGWFWYSWTGPVWFGLYLAAFWAKAPKARTAARDVLVGNGC